MTNKILAKWAHFINHEISTIVTKTPKHGGDLLIQQMVDLRGDLDIHDHIFAGNF